MSKQREALELALEALEKHGNSYLNHEDEYSAAIKKIREALAEPEQKPVCFKCGHAWHPDECVNTTPPARKPLTDEDISAIVQSMSAHTWDAHMLARLIEKAHGITE